MSFKQWKKNKQSEKKINLTIACGCSDHVS